MKKYEKFTSERIEDFEDRREALLGYDDEDHDIVSFVEIRIRRKDFPVVNKAFCGFDAAEFERYYPGKVHMELCLRGSAYTTREEQPDFQYIFDLGMQALKEGQELKERDEFNY